MAVALKVSGATYQEIADQLGWTSHTTAIRAVERAFTSLPTPNLEQLRELELRRLDGLWAANYIRAIGDPGDPRVGRPAAEPNVDAANICLRVHDRRVKLLGLYREPTRDLEEELRAWAEAEGLDPDSVIRDAEGVVSMHQRRKP